MSIETVEITSPGSFSVVEVRQGPAGTGGGGSNSVTSATTSDGTANLSISNVTTATAEVTGTLTANHIHGNLAGNVYAHVRAGEALAKGDPVYVSGSHGSGSTLIAIVSKADASNAAKMPAVGIMDADLANNATGHMVIVGTITELATNAYSINAELYVEAGGGMTATPPTARAQPVARVERSNLNNGAILVKVNGLSASDATASTLARRDSAGGCQFSDLSATVSFDAGTFSVGAITGSTFEAGSSVTFNATTYTYGTGAASAHRFALNGGAATGEALFTAVSASAARTTLGLISRVTTADVFATSTTPVAIPELTFPVEAGKHYRVDANLVIQSSATPGYQLTMTYPNNARTGQGYSWTLHAANQKIPTLAATSMTWNPNTTGNPNVTIGVTGYAYLRPTASGNVTFTTSHQAGGSGASTGPLTGSTIIVTEL